MAEKKLSDLQLKLLEMLAWFDSFCRENNLTYYALGGTMLGAARHQGFIPWDDDIDVGMPREDYAKLEKIMNGKQFDNYVLETPNSKNRDFCYSFSKLYDVTTTLVENCRKPMIRGIYLDIFPLDGLGEDKKLGEIWYKRIKLEKLFYVSRITSLRKGRDIKKNIAVVISRMIPNIFVDNVKLRKDIDKKCQRYSLEKSAYGGNLLGNWGLKEITPVEIIGEPVEYQFENIKIYGFKDCDTYLTHVYGDWRKLPPKEKQVTHHDFVMYDLNKSYLDKNKGV